MKEIELLRLEPVDLREIWEREDGDFTPWLARSDNLELLGDAIGIELETEGIEKEVGPFRADILCRDTATGDWVLVENQLEKTDHTHLGQLLTYAAGLGTATIVWIAKRFTEEHRAAIDWLNSITGDRFNFFAIELEAYRIGNSPVAPKLNIVAKPNDWTRRATGLRTRLVSSESSSVTELYLEYWSLFCDYLRDTDSFLKLQKPQPQYWHIFAVGRSGFHLSARISTKERVIGCTLVMDDDFAKQYYKLLYEEKGDVEQELGKKLIWREMPDYKSSRISYFMDADPADKTKWPEQHRLLKGIVEDFHRVFSGRIKGLLAE